MGTRDRPQQSYPAQQWQQPHFSSCDDGQHPTGPNDAGQQRHPIRYDPSFSPPLPGTPSTNSYRGDSSIPVEVGTSRATMSHSTAMTSAPTMAEQDVEEWNNIHSWGLMTRTIAQYQRLEQIGEGTYGQVYKARCISTGRDVALKKIRVHHGGYKGLPTTAIREIKIMKRLHHNNMVELIEVLTSKGVEFLDDDDCREDEKPNRENDPENDKKISTTTSDPDLLTVDRSSSKPSKKDKMSDKNMDTREGFKGNLFLVLEYVSHDLTGLMDMCYRFTEVQAKCIFRQLLEVLDYIHTNNYAHRDLKCSNILLTSRFQLKLADFGLARSLDDSSFLYDNSSIDTEPGRQDFTNKVITLWYRPPELLLGETKYGTSVDIWSAGCILGELLLGRPIFTGKTEMEQLSLIFDLVGTPTEERWEGYSNLKLLRTGEMAIGKPRDSTLRHKYGSKNKMSPTAIDLLEKMLELDPTKRITAGRALTSRYFLTEPRVPENPEELGEIDLGASGADGHFHEFQTKKRRREAKIVAEKARKDAKARGLNEKQTDAAYSAAYEEHIKKMAAEGLQGDKSARSPARLSEKDRPDARGEETAENLKNNKKEEHEIITRSKLPMRREVTIPDTAEGRSTKKKDQLESNATIRGGERRSNPTVERSVTYPNTADSRYNKKKEAHEGHVGGEKGRSEPVERDATSATTADSRHNRKQKEGDRARGGETNRSKEPVDTGDGGKKGRERVESGVASPPRVPWQRDGSAIESNDKKESDRRWPREGVAGKNTDDGNHTNHQEKAEVDKVQDGHLDSASDNAGIGLPSTSPGGRGTDQRGEKSSAVEAAQDNVPQRHIQDSPDLQYHRAERSDDNSQVKAGSADVDKQDNRPELGDQKKKRDTHVKSKRSRSRSESVSSSTSSSDSSSSSESSQSDRRRRSSRSRKRRSTSPGRGSRRSSEKRKGKGKEHRSRRKRSRVSDQTQGSHRDGERATFYPRIGRGERTQRDGSSERHRAGNERGEDRRRRPDNERVREQGRAPTSHLGSWDRGRIPYREAERPRDRDIRDHRRHGDEAIGDRDSRDNRRHGDEAMGDRDSRGHRRHGDEAMGDVRQGQGSFRSYSDGPRSWREPSFGQERPPSSERWNRFPERQPGGPMDQERRENRGKRAEREDRGKRRW